MNEPNEEPMSFAMDFMEDDDFNGVVTSATALALGPDHPIRHMGVLGAPHDGVLTSSQWDRVVERLVPMLWSCSVQTGNLTGPGWTLNTVGDILGALSIGQDVNTKDSLDDLTGEEVKHLSTRPVMGNTDACYKQYCGTAGAGDSWRMHDYVDPTQSSVARS